MLKPEEDDLLMPSSILGYSSEHFQLRCLQFHPDAAHTNYVEILTRALLCQQTCQKDFRTAVVDNIDPSSTTVNDSFHGTSVFLARQTENEGEMRMLSESVDTSTRKYGFNYLPADYTHVLPVPCPPSEQLMPLLQGHCSQVISRRWKVMTGKKRRPRGLYTLC